MSDMVALPAKRTVQHTTKPKTCFINEKTNPISSLFTDHAALLFPAGKG